LKFLGKDFQSRPATATCRDLDKGIAVDRANGLPANYRIVPARNAASPS